jgi:CheY-like chemotaxis protein
VDDVPINCQFLQEFLEPLGFDVQTAQNAQAAMEQAFSWQPDLILMDVIMPGTSGIEATQELRAHGWSRPILAVSASVLQADIEQTLQAGYDAFLPKPVKPDDLLALLAQHLHLTWQYADHTQALEPEVRPELIMPERAELEALYGLARRGNLLAIEARLKQLASQDPRYQPFADQITRLTRGFEERKVRLLLQEYLERA